MTILPYKIPILQLAINHYNYIKYSSNQIPIVNSISAVLLLFYYYYLKLYSAHMVELAVLHTWLVTDECTPMVHRQPVPVAYYKIIIIN